jgi:CMP-N-acetylneuraminic acid synthetase
LRTAQHIDEAIGQLIANNNDAVISVCEVEHSPLWCNTLPENKDMTYFLRDEVLGKRSQDLETYYRLNGAIYICDTQKLLDAETFFLKHNSSAYIMDKKYSIDIDDEFDFKQAECLMTTFHKNTNKTKA